jgi:hypothetical protein
MLSKKLQFQEKLPDNILAVRAFKIVALNNRYSEFCRFFHIKFFNLYTHYSAWFDNQTTV